MLAGHWERGITSWVKRFSTIVLYFLLLADKEISFITDHQINAPDSSQPEPLALIDFAANLYHAERATVGTDAQGGWRGDAVFLTPS